MIIQKVKKQHIIESLRFDGSYHLSDGTLYLRKLRKMPHQDLQCLCSDIFTAGRRKRVYTENDKGFPYLSNSDVVKGNPLDGCKFNSKKYAFDEPSFLKEGMIVTGRVGAIGQTAYITSELEEKQAMGSDNIIRIVCKDKNLSGYVYSFLTSKYGNTLINRLAAGGVQPYISEDLLKDIPIPILSEEIQQQIHQLIVEASELRVEANKLLREAVSFFDFLKTDYVPGKAINKNVSIKKLNNSKKRFDANYNIISSEVDRVIDNQRKDLISIVELSENIFIGPRTKRNYVENGVPFLSTSEMQKSNPTKTEKSINQKVANDFVVKEGWLLTTRSGTLGDTIYTLPCLNDYAVSEDAIRIVLKKDALLSNKYLFAFLKSNLGKSSLLSGSYGSVILHLNEEYIGDIKVPILEQNEIQRIEERIDRYVQNINNAILKENQAIALIEKEIDLWQVS